MQVCVINNPLPLSDVEKMQMKINQITDFIHEIYSGNATETTYGHLVDALLITNDLIHSLDNANDFYKIGGFGLLLPLLDTKQVDVITRTSELIADLVQNNAFCQEKALEDGLLNKLVDLLSNNSDTTVCIKALYAVSCLCRQNHKAIKHLKGLDAVSVLLQIIQKPVEKLRSKTAFFLTHLSIHEPGIRNALYDAGVIELLIQLLGENDDSSHEHLLSALLALVQNHEQSKRKCIEQRDTLKNILDAKLQEYEGKSEFRESTEYCTKLKYLCFSEE